jgi:hypothetical protein
VVITRDLCACAGADLAAKARLAALCCEAVHVGALRDCGLSGTWLQSHTRALVHRLAMTLSHEAAAAQCIYGVHSASTVLKQL